MRKSAFIFYGMIAFPVPGLVWAQQAPAPQPTPLESCRRQADFWSNNAFTAVDAANELAKKSEADKAALNKQIEELRAKIPAPPIPEAPLRHDEGPSPPAH